MSNKNFEDKVLKALWNIEKDISWLKTDVSGLKTDVSGLKTDVSSLKSDVSDLKSDISRLDQKIDKVETSLTRKIDSQTYELKQEIRSNATYLDQAFNQINKIDKEIYMDKKNIRYSYA